MSVLGTNKRYQQSTKLNEKLRTFLLNKNVSAFHIM